MFRCERLLFLFTDNGIFLISANSSLIFHFGKSTSLLHSLNFGATSHSNYSDLLPNMLTLVITDRALERDLRDEKYQLKDARAQAKLLTTRCIRCQMSMNWGKKGVY